MRLAMIVALCLPHLATTVVAQTSDAGADQALSDSLAATAKAMHASIRRNLAEAAESMPTENYGFRPTPQVRTFVQLIGHATNANLLFRFGGQGRAISVETKRGEPDNEGRRADGAARFFGIL